MRDPAAWLELATFRSDASFIFLIISKLSFQNTFKLHFVRRIIIRQEQLNYKDASMSRKSKSH
jgi:hypothetical protein